MKIYFVLNFEAIDAQSAVVSCFDTEEAAGKELEALELYSGEVVSVELNESKSD